MLPNGNKPRRCLVAPAFLQRIEDEACAHDEFST